MPNNFSKNLVNLGVLYPHQVLGLSDFLTFAYREIQNGISCNASFSFLDY